MSAHPYNGGGHLQNGRSFSPPVRAQYSSSGGSAPPSLPDRFNISPAPSQGRLSLPPDMRGVSSPPSNFGRVPCTPPKRGRTPPPQAHGQGRVQRSPPPASYKREGGGEKKNILSRNINGTFVMTTQPSNESELQLYRVLQRANLLHYYDTFISQGGDDVQQLCEAGEEEFLEIMALVGMASKPLHVRRLQKALQEWVQNPGLFQSPLLPSISGFHNSTAAAAAAVIRASVGATIPTVTVAPSVLGGVSVPTSVFVNVSSPHTVLGAVHPPSLVPSSVSQLLVQSRVLPHPPSSPPPQQPPRPHSSNSPSHKVEREGLRLVVRDNRDSEGRGDREGSIPSPPNSQGELSHPGGSTSPLMLTPVLMESQIQRIADTACALVKSLPDLEPKQPNAKKKICKELEFVMGMSEEDNRKMDEIRKFSAIYGRFDCKRKPEKPLTLHEVSVNEAAAQICRLVPAMLTRRDELFPLARQVVRDSGYQYSKGHSRSTFTLSGKLFGEDGLGPFKRMRYAEDSEITQRRRERLDQICEESRLISERVEELRTAGGQIRGQGADLHQIQQITQQLELLQSKQQQLLQERDEHQRCIRFSSRVSTCSDPERGDTDDENSQRSYSNASSPSASLQAPPNYVLSASGGQIIAVQNPALSLSGAFGGRGSPPISVQAGHLSGGLRNRSTPPHSASPSMKQEPSSPPPYPPSSKD